jgi:hypothetical protein
VFINDLLLNIGVFLALNSSYSYLILVLAAVSSAQGVKMVIILSLELFKGPAAILLAAVFLGIVVRALGNFG